MKKGSPALRKLHMTRKHILCLCAVPNAVEKVEAALEICCQSTLLVWTKALMKMNYFGKTLRLGRINLILSAQDNVILYMQTIYRTFLEATSSRRASLLPNINYRY